MMIDEERYQDGLLYSKLLHRIAWINHNEPGLLGEDGHELMQFVATKALDNMEDCGEDNSDVA